MLLLFFSEEAHEYIEIGALNGLFVLGRSMGFVGKLCFSSNEFYPIKTLPMLRLLSSKA